MAHLEELIARTETELSKEIEEYKEPTYPFPIFPSIFEKCDMGHEMLHTHFLLNREIFFLNHGSYGATPRVVIDVMRQWQNYMEYEPVQFLSNSLLNYLNDNIRCLADFVGSDPEDIALVDNATTGVNTVLKSLKYKEGDNIVYMSIGYQAINFTIDYISDYYNFVEKVKIQVDLPIDMEKVLQDFENAITSKTKICVIDHITSSTAIIFPIKRFIDIAHKMGTLIIIDGAHAIGHVPLNLRELDVDFYTSNCHKWICAPKGTAFLYVNKKHKDNIVPLSISHGYHQKFNGKFSWIGTRDFSNWLCIKSSIEFYKSVGMDRWRDYTYKLLREAYTYLTGLWKTKGVLTEFKDEYIGQFATIELPPPNQIPGTSDTERCIYIQDKLFQSYRIEIPVMNIQGKIYVRISAQIYNELSDYMGLGDAIMEIFGYN